MSGFDQDDPFFRSLRALRSMLVDKSASCMENARDDKKNGSNEGIFGPTAVAETPQKAVPPAGANHRSEMIDAPLAEIVAMSSAGKSSHTQDSRDNSTETKTRRTVAVVASPEFSSVETVPNQDPVNSLENELHTAETKARLEEALRQSMERTLKDLTEHHALVEEGLKNATALNKLLQEEISEMQKKEEGQRQARLKEKKRHQEEIDKLVGHVQSVQSQRDSMEAKMIGAQKMEDRFNTVLERTRQISSFANSPEERQIYIDNEINVLRAQLIDTQNELEETRQTLKEVTEQHVQSSVEDRADRDAYENPEIIEQELSVLQNAMNRLQEQHSVAIKNAQESQNIVQQLRAKLLKADTPEHSMQQKQAQEVEGLRQRILDLERELEHSKQAVEHFKANVETGRSQRDEPYDAEEVSIADENDTEEKEELRKILAEKSALLEQHKKFAKYAHEKMKSLVDQNALLKNQLEESEHIQKEYEDSLQDAESELAKLRKNLKDVLKGQSRRLVHSEEEEEEEMSSDPEASGKSAEEDQNQSEDDDDDDEVEVIGVVKMDRDDYSEDGEEETGDDETEEADYSSSDEDHLAAEKLNETSDPDGNVGVQGSKRKREKIGESSHEEGCDDSDDDDDTADDDEDDLDVVEIVDKPASKKQKEGN